MGIVFAARRSLSILSVAACLAVLPAQQRKPLVGRVLDASGLAVTDAQVTLVWSPPGGPEGGEPDVVACTTDARGRFVANLLPQQCYSAWAIATAADGTGHVSPVREGAAAGGDLDLRLELPATRRRLQLVGAQAWAAVAPLRIEVAPRAANVLGHALGADGLAPLLPPLGLALVRDHEDRLLCLRNLPQGDESEPLLVTLPPPCTITLKVLGPTCEPIAGATVRHATVPLDFRLVDTTALFERPGFSAWRQAGTSADDGTVTVIAPCEPGPGPWPLLVRAPGMAESLIPSAPANCAMVMTLQLAPRLRLCEGSAPLRGAEILLTAGHIADLRQRVGALHLDDSGTCELPILPGAIESMLHVRPRPDDPWHLLRISCASGEVLQVDLSGLRRLSLQYVDENGSPARGLNGVLVAKGSPYSGQQQVVVSTDQAGRLERVLGGDAWLLLVTDGVRWHRFDVPRADAPGATREIVSTVTCQTLPIARFCLIDSDGLPVTGARVILGPGAPCGVGPGADLYTTLVRRLAPLLTTLPRSDDWGFLDVPLFAAHGQSSHATIRAPQGPDCAAVVLGPGEVKEVKLSTPGACAAGR